MNYYPNAIARRIGLLPDTPTYQDLVSETGYRVYYGLCWGCSRKGHKI